MRRVALTIAFAAVLGAVAAPAAGQGGPDHFLAADASKTGLITLVFFGSAGSTVTFRERVDERAADLGTRPIGPSGAAVLTDAATWRCDRRTRRFEAVGTTSYGKELTASFEVRTPSCRTRLTVAVPARARRGARVIVRIRDTWKLGGIRPRLCVAPPRAPLSCRTVTFGSGAASASRRFRADTTGRWRVEVRLGRDRLRRSVAVGRRSAPSGPARPVFLTTGDSTIQGIDAFLADELAGRAEVRSQYFVGTGLSSPFSPWPGLPAKQRREFSPDATVISLGANEGSAMNGAECCGEPWVAEYARRAGTLMASYGRVVWLTLPVPRDEKRRLRTAAVNAGVIRAATGRSGVRLIRLDELFTPGGTYRETIRFRGQTVRLRQPDGVHLTLPALSIAAGLVADALPAGRRR